MSLTMIMAARLDGGPPICILDKWLLHYLYLLCSLNVVQYSEGGFFKAHLIFPKEYPQKPPKMTFISEMWHPNGRVYTSMFCGLLSFCFTVEKNGDVCISILHDPGEDKWGYERPEERWLPIHTVETIIMSVISMISDPNDQSPANVDAAVKHR